VTGRGRWIVAGFVLGAAAVGAALVVSASGSSSGSVQADVVDLSAGGDPLRGRPLDLIRVGHRYVGLVAAANQPVVVTSTDGRRWRAERPSTLPFDAVHPPASPGGLDNASHVLFTDGRAVYLRTQRDVVPGKLGTTSLHVSDADAGTWRPVVLPVPTGKGAFPIAAARVGDRRVVAGAVYDPEYGRSYLDAAVWVSDRGSAFRRIDAPVLAGDGNQTIFSLAVSGSTIVAGGGDGSLIPVDMCCYYPDAVASWRTVDGGDTWVRSPLDIGPYQPFDRSAIVGFVEGRGVLEADVAGFPPFSAVSTDQGGSWKVDRRESIEAGGVLFPRASNRLDLGSRLVATTLPSNDCSDCTQGAIAVSTDGVRWRAVTPRFPCGTKGRTNYGFVSRPVMIGDHVVALGGCGEQLGDGFRQTLLAVGNRQGTGWRVERPPRPTGDPLPAVVSRGRIVTLVAENPEEPTGRVRAVVVGR